MPRAYVVIASRHQALDRVACGRPARVVGDQLVDDALGGTAYYLGRFEVEIPLGSGARELGLRPSIYAQFGSLFNITRPLPTAVFPTTTDAAGNLDLTMDPKLAWALQHREAFPVDVNAGTREQLLRVPGMGVKSVDRLIQARRHRRLRMEDLARLKMPMSKVAPFVVAADHQPGGLLDSARLSQRLVPKAQQMQLAL